MVGCDRPVGFTRWQAHVSVSGEAAIRLNSFRRIGSASAANPTDKPSACFVVSAASETGPQHSCEVAESRIGWGVFVILILINITDGRGR